MVMGILVALLLFTPIMYSSYIAPSEGDEPTVKLVVIEPLSAPNQSVPDILGTSVDWTDNANGLYDDVSGLLNPAPVSQLINLDPSHLRFPATRLSQVYDWEAGVGNRNERGYNPSHGPKPQLSLFGTDEFFKLVDHVGADPVMVVNSNTGSAQAAADWVSYCNDGSNEGKGIDRAANGYLTPYRIRDWEIGYEPYLPKYWEGKTSVENPAGKLYGQMVRNYSLAMKSVDPNIKVGAWMVLHPDTELHSADRSWNLNFLNAAGGKFNLEGDDRYFFDYVVVKVDLPDIDLLLDFPDLYRYSYAETLRSMRDHMAQLRGLLIAQSREDPIPLAIASFEPSFGSSGWNTEAPANAASALITADLAMQMLSTALDDGEQSILYGCYGDLNTPTYSSLMINPDFEAAHIETWGQSPNYLALELASKMEGLKPLGLTVLEGPTYDLPREGEFLPHNNVPYISAFAVGDTTDGTVRILIVNRDLTRSIKCHVSVDMRGLSARPEMSVRELEFESILSTNLVGQDVTSPLPSPDSRRGVSPDGFSVTVGRAGVALVTLRSEEVS